MTPTRELCIQVTQALRSYAEHMDIEVVAVFGGQPIAQQAPRLRAGAQVVVATVGRMMDLISRHILVLTAVRFVVLDEADEMLDLGFIEDVEKILRMCPSGRQTGLFSATMPPPIAKLAERHMYDPVTISITPKQLTVDAIEQAYVEVAARDKAERLREVLKAEEPEQAIIFCRTKIGTARLDEQLRNKGLRCKALHGDMTPGPARRRDAPVQGPQAAAPGRHRRRGPRARHRARHPRHQLRPAEQHRDLRPPDRADRPRRPHRPGDHLRDPGADGGDPADRARGEDRDRRVGAARGAAQARAAPAQARARATEEAKPPATTARRRTAPSCSSTAARAAASSRRTCAGPWSRAR